MWWIIFWLLIYDKKNRFFRWLLGNCDSFVCQFEYLLTIKVDNKIIKAVIPLCLYEYKHNIRFIWNSICYSRYLNDWYYKVIPGRIVRDERAGSYRAMQISSNHSFLFRRIHVLAQVRIYRLQNLFLRQAPPHFCFTEDFNCDVLDKLSLRL